MPKSIPLDLAQLDIRADGRWIHEDEPVTIWVGFDGASVRPALSGEVLA